LSKGFLVIILLLGLECIICFSIYLNTVYLILSYYQKKTFINAKLKIKLM